MSKPSGTRVDLSHYVNNGNLGFTPYEVSAPTLLSSILLNDTMLANVTFTSTEVPTMGIFVSFDYGGEYHVTVHESVVQRMYFADENNMIKRNYYLSSKMDSSGTPGVTSTRGLLGLEDRPKGGSVHLQDPMPVLSAGSRQPSQLSGASKQTPRSLPARSHDVVEGIIDLFDTNFHLEGNSDYYYGNEPIGPFIGSLVEYYFRFPNGMEHRSNAIPFLKWLVKQNKDGAKPFTHKEVGNNPMVVFLTGALRGEQQYPYLLLCSIHALHNTYEGERRFILSKITEYNLSHDIENTLSIMVSVTERALSNNRNVRAREGDAFQPLLEKINFLLDS